MDRPELPVSCCGAFQADERHFVWNETAQAWGCALKGPTAPPGGSAVAELADESPQEPTKPTPKPRATRGPRKKS